MKYVERGLPSQVVAAFRRVGLPVLVTALLWLTSRNSITVGQAITALALLFIPWLSYLHWCQRKNDYLPVFGMISFMYWVYYALALFWGDLTIQMARSAFGREAPPEQLTNALLMSLLGVSCLWLGMKTGIGRIFTPRRLTELVLDGSRRDYLRGVLIVSALLSMAEPSTYLLGPGGRQFIVLSISFIPLLSFAMLFRVYMRGEASRFDKALIFGFLLVRLVVGLSSGWLGSATSIIIICAVTFLAERRRIPRVAVVALVLLTLFFQVGKEEFRKVYWTDQTQASQFDRVSFWVNSSFESWNSALLDPSGDLMRDLLNQSVSRVSLLTQSANVLDQTPEVVPYQNGNLYKYLFITLIPRFVWPDKPSFNEANRFYQVAYGITAEEDLGNVSIGVGVLAEAFISFGWVGVIAIMFLLGVFFDFFQSSFLGRSSGLLMTSLGIASLPQMLGLEAQMATYLGGIVQQVSFSLIVMLPIIRWNQVRQQPKLSAIILRETPTQTLQRSR